MHDLTSDLTPEQLAFIERLFAKHYDVYGDAKMMADPADDDAADDEDDPEDDSEDIDLSEDEEKPKPKDDPGDDVEKLKEALRKERKARRAAERASKVTKPDADEEADKAAKALEDAEKRYKPMIVRREAKVLLAAAGVKVDKTDRLLKLIDMDDVDLDEDGDVSGLDDQIDSLKDEYPELFDTEEAPRRRRSPRGDTADRGGSGGPRKTSADKLVAGLLGTK